MNSLKTLRLTAALILVSCLALLPPRTSSGQSATPPTRDRSELIRRVKRLEQQMMLSEGFTELRQLRERARILKLGRHARQAKEGGLHQRPATIPELGFGKPTRPPFSARDEQSLVSALGPNVLVNDTTGDPANAFGQSEPSIVAWGNYVLAAWNNGKGFFTDSDLMAYGYSTDGGLTFHDGGVIPRPTGYRWASDPVLTVNEKTGDFYFVGLILPSATTNGVAIAHATFSGPHAPTWETAQIIRQVSNTTEFIDKPWAVVDSTTSRIYVTYTDFFANVDKINFQRSTTSWTSWSTPLQMNDPGTNGLVQGSRPVVGPSGEVYVAWKEIGLTDADYMRIRKSTNEGSTFASAAQAAAIYDNFGTGAPGFNRERGITFPSIAVDRSPGPRRGYVYVAWNECINWYPSLETVGTTGTVNEVEPNSAPGIGTPFTIGQKLVGHLTWTTSPAPAHGETDYWKFTATQGQSYTFWCDSIPSTLYSMRVICLDDTTRLNLSGDLDPPANNQNGFIVWTCPRSGTYSLRMFNNITDNATCCPSGSYYEVLTGEATPGSGSVARDQRDVMVVSSPDGSSFSAPTRPNNDPPYFDDWLPEVAVSGDGRLYAFWYGWHESPDLTCGGESHLYLARSDDGGATWSDVGRVTDAITAWTFTVSNIQPNQGDYIALFANDLNLYPAWTDGRFGNPDIFAMALPLSSTPALVSLASADAEPNRVTVTWYAASDQVMEAYVYRLEGQDWVLKAVVDRDGQNRLTYVDTDVFPGVKYSYRLGVREGGFEQYFGEVSVIVPSLNYLRIESVRPNPTSREVWVSFTLPQGGPARLSLIDIGGRRVRAREVGSLGPGKHLLDLGAGLHLPTGVYVVRLEQGGKVETSRVSVVR